MLVSSFKNSLIKTLRKTFVYIESILPSNKYIVYNGKYITYNGKYIIKNQ